MIHLFQIKFWEMSTVLELATQGLDHPYSSGHAKTYQLAFSDDCVTFQPLQDAAGNNAVYFYMKHYLPFTLFLISKNKTKICTFKTERTHFITATFLT